MFELDAEAQQHLAQPFRHALNAILVHDDDHRLILLHCSLKTCDRLNAMRSGAGENVAGMMMAARKGKKLSEKDEEGTLDDLAQFEALENEGNEEE
jgi:hypothetical protein